MEASERKRGARRCVRMFSSVLVAVALVACGSGGGGGGDVEPPPPPPGGSGTGADGVAIFWSLYDTSVANGFGYSVQQTGDGGFVAAGSQMTGFTGGTPNDFYVQKTDRLGLRAWSRRVPWSGGGIAYAVRATADGGYLAAGTGGALSNARTVLIKFDAAGNVAAGWPKTYGPAGGAFALHAVNGGADGFLAIGTADAGAGQGSNLYVLRIDAAGTVLWQKFDYPSFCPEGYEAGRAIASTRDGHYVIAGVTGCFQWAGFLLKIDGATGNELWRRTYDDVNAATFVSLESVAVDADDNLIAAGRSGSDCGPAVGGTCDALVIKTDAAGNVLWRRTYGGAEKDAANAVAIAPDGNYLIAGFSRSYGGAIADRSEPWQWSDAMLIKIAPDGSTVWHKIKGVRPPGEDLVNAIGTTTDGGFVVAGSSGGSVMLAKFDKNGDTVNLGPAYDLTINVPPVQGVIAFGNAVEVAAVGARGLILPRRVAGTLLDLFLAAAQGQPPSDFCTGGGTYAFNPSATLAVGTYALTFTDCVLGPATDRSRLGGRLTLNVETLSGTPAAGNYTMQGTATAIALTTEDVGTAAVQSFGGGLRIARTASAGALNETITTLSGGVFTVSETDGGSVRSASYAQFNLRYALPASGVLSVGQAGDASTATVGGDTFTIAVSTPLALTPSGAPLSGIYRITAQDASRLTATLSGGAAGAVAQLAIDTDGDGTDDGLLSVPWESVF